jgi:hypothetical protein
MLVLIASVWGAAVVTYLAIGCIAEIRSSTARANSENRLLEVIGISLIWGLLLMVTYEEVCRRAHPKSWRERWREAWHEVF